jgi:adenine-specific DNA-methyltransferase
MTPVPTQEKEKELALRISTLEAEIKALKERKKYGLVWDDKPEDVVLQCRENVPMLQELKTKRVVGGSVPATNILIEGDNYHALSVLNYTHRSAFDVIYVDPPYNTGARDWKYNNDFVDSEDPYKHTKWVSFMDHRLRLTKQLLSDDGICCVTIDDYEMPRLWMLMEEIFGEDNHLGTAAIRINPGGRKTKRSLATQHEYALFFSKNPNTQVAKIVKDVIDKTHSYKQDENGRWYEERNLRKEGQDSLAADDSDRFYPIYVNSRTGAISSLQKFDIKILPIDTQGKKRIWRRGKNDIDQLYRDGDIFTKETKHGTQLYFRFRGGVEGETPKSFWEDARYSASEHGTQILDEILGNIGCFPFPKSLWAVVDCIKVCSQKKDATVLDFFAGSGTTGHAVLELNKMDGGNRRFVLCTNNENNICEDVTYERLKRVIKGYKNNKGEKILGLGGNMAYYRTALVNAERLQKVSDETKIRIAYQAGEMIAVRENTPDELEKNDWWQLFRGEDKFVAIYFKEDKTRLFDLVGKLEKKGCPVVLYIFGWGKNEYKNDYGSVNIRVEDIPEPILEVYKELNRL